MNKTVLAPTFALRRKSLRQFLPFFLAAACLAGFAAFAQEKTASPTHGSGWVVIPVNEYRVLRAKAYPVEPTPEPPPLDATLTRVDYELHVLGDLATGTAHCDRGCIERWLGARSSSTRVVSARGQNWRANRFPSSPVIKGKPVTHLCALLSHAGRWTVTALRGCAS